jgi:hypothetical protein
MSLRAAVFWRRGNLTQSVILSHVLSGSEGVAKDLLRFLTFVRNDKSGFAVSKIQRGFCSLGCAQDRHFDNLSCHFNYLFCHLDSFAMLRINSGRNLRLGERYLLSDCFVPFALLSVLAMTGLRALFLFSCNDTQRMVTLLPVSPRSNLLFWISLAFRKFLSKSII